MTTQKELRERRIAERANMESPIKNKTWSYPGKKKGPQVGLGKGKVSVKKRIATKGAGQGFTLRKLVIDLDGPDANAFYLLGLAKKWCLQLELNYAPIYHEMNEGDFAQMVEVFKKHFGMFVTIINTEIIMKKPILRVEGEIGNGDYLLGKAMKIAKAKKMDCLAIRREAMSDDKKNLLEVLNKYFDVRHKKL